MLDEALRVTGHRLIITESVYRNPVDRFWLVLLDAHINRLRHAGLMNSPLAFRTSAEWSALFGSRGWRCTTTR